MKSLSRWDQSQINFDSSAEGRLSKMIDISEFSGNSFFSGSDRGIILKAIYSAGLFHPILYPYPSLGGYLVNFTTINYSVEQ